MKTDHVELYKAKDGWRWRRKAPNGEIVADSGEAYDGFGDAKAMAERQDVPVIVSVDTAAEAAAEKEEA